MQQSPFQEQLPLPPETSIGFRRNGERSQGPDVSRMLATKYETLSNIELTAQKGKDSLDLPLDLLNVTAHPTPLPAHDPILTLVAAVCCLAPPKCFAFRYSCNSILHIRQVMHYLGRGRHDQRAREMLGYHMLVSCYIWQTSRMQR